MRLLLLLAALAVVAAAPLKAAETAPAPTPAAEAARAAAKAEQAMVALVARLKASYVFIGGGSGVLISADGLMVTNHHVAGSSHAWSVRVGTKLYPAEVVGTDPYGDITLLKLANAERMPYVELADSDKLFVGQRVIAIGNPFAAAELDGDPTITQGIVSALHRFQNNYTDAIQTDAPINPGNSGGPLLTLDGKLAGINGQIASRTGERANTGIGYAIPAAQIKRFLPKLKEAKGGFVYHGVIRGLQGDNGEGDGMRHGAEVARVMPGSAADRLGFKAGDRITHVAGYRVLNTPRFLGVLGTYPADSTLPVTVMRDGRSQVIDVTLEPQNPGSFGFLPKPPAMPAQGTIDDLRKAMLERVVVDKVFPQLAAAKAGLQPGDVIVGVGERSVGNFAEWGACMRDLGMLLAGDVLKVKFRRSDEEKSVDLVLTSAWDQHD